MIYNERRSLPVWKRILVSILSIVMLALQTAIFIIMIVYTAKETLDVATGMSILYVVTEILGFILVSGTILGIIGYIIEKKRA